jgi:hypothetical protein
MFMANPTPYRYVLKQLLHHTSYDCCSSLEKAFETRLRDPMSVVVKEPSSRQTARADVRPSFCLDDSASVAPVLLAVRFGGQLQGVDVDLVDFV